MHVYFVLLIFTRGAFIKNINYTILFVLNLTCQPKHENFMANIEKLSNVFYYIFMNKYISRLEVDLKCDSSKKPAKKR